MCIWWWLKGMERGLARGWTTLLVRQVHPEPSLGTDPVAGHSPPWQSAPRPGCAPSLHPAARTSAGAAAWPGTGRPDLLQQWWPRPPAASALEGTGGGRVLTSTSPASATHAAQLHPRKTFPPTSHPSCTLGLEGGDEMGGSAPGLPVCLSHHKLETRSVLLLLQPLPPGPGVLRGMSNLLGSG